MYWDEDAKYKLDAGDRTQCSLRRLWKCTTDTLIYLKLGLNEITQEEAGGEQSWGQGPVNPVLLVGFIQGRGASLVAQMVKNLPATQETWVWFLGREDPLEKGMETHSSNLAWRIPWTEEAGGLQSMG